MKYKENAKQLIALEKKDLAMRNRLLKKGQLEKGYNEEMSKLHQENAQTLDEIMNSIGYPTIDKVGKEGSYAAWLVIQHAIGLPKFMKKSAHLLEKAVCEGRANPVNLAYLKDRIAVLEGKPQSYGTQFDWDESGKMSPQKFDDLDQVNLRRKSLGLNTLEEQTKIMRMRTKDENQSPPEDIARRSIEIDKWKKSVGWKK